MSNLSELLPAGSSVKSADFVAQGTLASGVTVGLRSDGKVEAISGVTQVIGSGSAYFQASSSNNYMQAAYDTANDKVVVSYRAGGNNDYGSAVVGTVSGNAISWGTPVVFSSSSTTYISIVFDSSNNKSVIAYAPVGDSSRGTAIVGTVSGTSISFGSSTVFDSGLNMEGSSCVFDTSNNKVVIAYDYGNGPAGKAIVGTVSGTGISFGSATTFMTVNPTYIDATFDSNSNKVLVTYKNTVSNVYTYVIVGTVSGTSISFGTPVVMSTAANFYTKLTFDSVANKVIGVYRDGGTSKGTVVVGTVSGTSISFGTAVTFTSFDPGVFGTTFDPSANRVIVLAQDATNSPYATYLFVGTVSGTSISMEAPVLVSNQNNNELSAVYDPDSNKVVGAWRFGTTGGQGAVITVGATNVSSYVGITDQAISSAATGKVVCKGGAITNTGLIPLAPVAGTPVVFKASRLNQTASTFDSANNKIVIVYKDYTNSSYGTAIVGTVSGSSISYGSPVVFSGTNAVSQPSCVFDPSSNKVVIAYGQGSTGVAIVGTVSGTSISFGSAVTFEASDTAEFTSSAYDANAQKVVIAYRGVSNYAYSLVGTVSGTSISFGTKVTFFSAYAEALAITYDANAQKVVIAWYGTSGYGTAIVGTVSGTNISFGSAANYMTSGESKFNTITYDSAAQKVVVAFQDTANSAKPTAAVGTVSGTSISFGTKVAISPYGSNYTSATFDSNQNKVLIAYEDYTVSGSGAVGTIAAGTVSGTSISFGPPVVFNSTASSVDITSAFDSNLNKTVISYQDGSGGSQVGESVVIDLSSNLTPNTAYFVQDDGTISTTSSTTKAGTALSTTSLLITG